MLGRVRVGETVGGTLKRSLLSELQWVGERARVVSSKLRTDNERADATHQPKNKIKKRKLPNLSLRFHSDPPSFSPSILKENFAMATATSAATFVPKSALSTKKKGIAFGRGSSRFLVLRASASAEKTAGGGGGVNGGEKKGVPNNSKYVVPLDKATSGLTRPLAEILRDLNKRVPDKIINHQDNSIPWYDHDSCLFTFIDSRHLRFIQTICGLIERLDPLVVLFSLQDGCSSTYFQIR